MICFAIYYLLVLVQPDGSQAGEVAAQRGAGVARALVGGPRPVDVTNVRAWNDLKLAAAHPGLEWVIGKMISKNVESEFFPLFVKEKMSNLKK